MGAFLTQHPKMARAVVSFVGIYDSLRTELEPNGAFNVTEFGTVQDPAQFRALYAYSPYHHVVDGVRYPAVLLLTGDNDGRVNPYNSRKMAARLQASNRAPFPSPVLSPHQFRLRPRHRQFPGRAHRRASRRLRLPLRPARDGREQGRAGLYGAATRFRAGRAGLHGAMTRSRAGGARTPCAPRRAEDSPALPFPRQPRISNSYHWPASAAASVN